MLHYSEAGVATRLRLRATPGLFVVVLLFMDYMFTFAGVAKWQTHQP